MARRPPATWPRRTCRPSPAPRSGCRRRPSRRAGACRRRSPTPSPRPRRSTRGRPERPRPRPSLALPAPPFQSLFQSAEPFAQRRDLLAEALGVRLRALALGLGARHGPSRPRRPVAKHLLHLALVGHDPFQARLHRALDEILPRLAVLDELMEKAGGERATV